MNLKTTLSFPYLLLHCAGVLHSTTNINTKNLSHSKSENQHKEALANRNGQRLITALQKGNIPREIMLMQRKHINLNATNENMDSPLILAVYKRYIRTSEELIKNGASLDMQDYSGQTALIITSSNRKYSYIASALINN